MPQRRRALGAAQPPTRGITRGPGKACKQVIPGLWSRCIPSRPTLPSHAPTTDSTHRQRHAHRQHCARRLRWSMLANDAIHDLDTWLERIKTSPWSPTTPIRYVDVMVWILWSECISVPVKDGHANEHLLVFSAGQCRSNARSTNSRRSNSRRTARIHVAHTRLFGWGTAILMLRRP